MALNYFPRFGFGYTFVGVSSYPYLNTKVYQMELVKCQFNVTYELKDGEIKATTAGVLNNGRAYGASVRVTCTNIYEVVNEKTQFTNDIKQEVSFKIPCPDDLTAGKVEMYFKEKFKKYRPDI